MGNNSADENIYFLKSFFFALVNIMRQKKYYGMS